MANSIDILNALMAVRSPGELIPILREDAFYIFGKAGVVVEAYIDRMDEDRRFCLRWDCKRKNFTFDVLSEYVDGKWSKFTGEGRTVEFTSQAGSKAVNVFLKELAMLEHFNGGRSFSAYRSEVLAAGWKTY